MSKILLTAGLGLMCAFSALGKAKTPDFNYPETVIKDATEQIKKAQKSGNHQALIDGLVRISLAKSIVSSDNVPGMINEVNGTAATVGDPCAKSLLYGLEADLLSSMYQHNRYRYDDREKAGATRPNDPRQWSREDFNGRICELADSALSLRETLAAIPVNDYKGILTVSAVCPEFVPTVYDMVAHHFIGLIDDTDGEDDECRPRLLGIYDSVLANHSKSDAAYVYTMCQRINCEDDSHDKQNVRYIALAEEYAASQYGIEPIISMIDNGSTDPKLTSLARHAVKAYPDYPRIGSLKAYIDRIDQRRITIEYPDAATSGKSIKIQVNAKNQKSLTIKAYILPAGYRDSYFPTKKLKSQTVAKEVSYTLKGDGEETVEFPALPSGVYALAPSFSDTATGQTVTQESSARAMWVSSIDIMMAACINGDYRLLVTDATTGRPVKGASVSVREEKNSKIIRTLVTDADGYAMLNSLDSGESYYFQAYTGTDRSKEFCLWTYGAGRHSTSELTGSVFTDRAVYRPGETVQFGIVAYFSSVRRLEVAKKKSLTVKMYNANSKCVAEKELTTDEFGRVDGSFTISTDGLTGTYSIRVNGVASKYIEVSEYKAPTFYIEVDKDKSELTDLTKVRIAGRAMTYSQFPLADTTVKVAISKKSYWWCWDEIKFESYETEVTTDSEGRFTVNVPAANFENGKGTIFLTATLSATDSRGETQSVTETLKAGKLSTLPQLADITANADKAVAIDSRLNQFDRLDYTIAKGDSVIAKGTLKAATLDASAIPSGEYTMTLTIPDSDTSRQFKLRLYRLTDKTPAFSTPLLLADEGAVKCADDGTFTLHWGNSSERWFFYVTACDGNVTDYGWHSAEAGMHQFTGKAEFSPRGQSCIWIYWMVDNELSSKCINLEPATPQDSIEIVTETFRDNLTPGGKETWKLRIKNNNGKVFKSAVIVNMYDAALNSIVPNEYMFSPAYESANEFWQSGASRFTNTTYISSRLQSYPTKQFTLPWLNYYNRRLQTALGYGRRMYKESQPLYECAMLAPMRSSANMVADSDFQLEESEVVSMDGNDTADTSSTTDTSALRDEGIKTAFFLPGLVTDEDCEVTFTFDVPNRNTQWQFSAVAYTADLHAAYINRLVSASKSLMVQPNVPRFVREGDRLTLVTGVMNNTDSEQAVDVEIVINGKKHTTKGVVLPPKSSQTVTVTYDVDKAQEVVVTTAVSQNGHMVDGQRDRIAVLPATTDVVEATPFYITADKSNVKIRMPRFNKDGRLTFEYADNPSWYAAAALPSMTQTAETATAHVVNYYITTVAAHIVKSNPEIAAAIEEWSKAESLKSPLQQNGDLKTTALDDTPWSRNADTETDMMRHLADITDASTVQYRQQRALTALRDLQRPDGGFEWFKGCRSSLWTTEEVLRLLGYLNEMGCFPADDAIAKRLVENAVKYCDRQYTDYSKREGVTRDDAINHAYDYVSIRTMLPVSAPTDTMAWIAAGAVDKAEKQWGDFGITGKAKTAMMLAGNGRLKAAGRIAESLRQTALKTTDHGTYWDVDDADKVRVATYALKALVKINPDDPTIDGVRHWLLLAKQAQCWGSTTKACDAISALLCTGRSLTSKTRKEPAIKVGKEAISFDGAAPYFGYLRRTLTTKGGDITISRDSGCPAWGAVYSQYSAPMDSVISHANSDIRIEKQFFVYDKANTLKPEAVTSFAVGDRIQVRLTIRTERDLDFVALTDDRGACFEPADKLSHYDWQDGTASYRETRDSATRIFFSHIAKGTYVITYDVFANNAGTYASGIATIQSQYAPSLTAHSSGAMLTVE